MRLTYSLPGHIEMDNYPDLKCSKLINLEINDSGELIVEMQEDNYETVKTMTWTVPAEYVKILFMDVKTRRI